MVYVFKGYDVDGNEHTFIVSEQTYELAYRKLISVLNVVNTTLTNLWRVDDNECHVHIINC